MTILKWIILSHSRLLLVSTIKIKFRSSSYLTSYWPKFQTIFSLYFIFDNKKRIAYLFDFVALIFQNIYFK